MTTELDTLLAEGFQALNRGDIAAAGKACEQALALDANAVQAHFLVGLVALEGKERPVAHRAFKSVVQLDPDHAAAWAHLARLHASEGRVSSAEAALKEVRRIQPTDAVVLDLTGMVLNQLGEYDAAKAFFARANTTSPGHPNYMMNLANVLVFLGDLNMAENIYRDVVDRDFDNPQAHWGLANTVKATDQAHIERMMTLLPRHTHNPRGTAFLQYAIGKESEDLKDWPAAFSAFASGAAARRQVVAFDEDAEIALFEAIKSTYHQDWLAAQASGHPSEAPIFVLGQPRTGTTLIERIITSHSQVHSAGELQQFGLAMRRLSSFSDPKRFSAELYTRAAKLAAPQLGAMYLKTSARMRGKLPRFVDKLPLNYLNIGLILASLPNAKIVHLVRNPADACFASFKQLFADAYLHSYDQREMARHHLRYLDLMAHFREQFPGRIIDIRYEDAASDLEPHARRLIEALELPWEDACLSFHESDRGVATASAAQVREPAHTRSVGRWRRYEEALGPMLEVLRAGGAQID